MGAVILAALCLWSCVLTVTPLDQEQVGRITNYFEKNIFQGVAYQHAYFVKFTDDECNKGLQTKDISDALKVDKSAGIPDIIKPKTKEDKQAKNEIYQGTRMVAASYLKGNKKEIHAESRLLNPDNSKDSPISNLLQKAPAAGCVLFFSLYSPCIKTCTNPNGKFNIIDKLKKVNLPESKNRAFAYTKVFEKDKETPRDEVLKNWGQLNQEMTLLCCKENNCIKCFNNGVLDEKCYTAKP